MDFSRLLVVGVEADGDERPRFEVLLLFDLTFEVSSFPALFFFFFFDLAFFSVYLENKIVPFRCWLRLKIKGVSHCYKGFKKGSNR